MVDKATLIPKSKQQEQIDQMEKAIYRIEQDTIQLRKILNIHTDIKLKDRNNDKK